MILETIIIIIEADTVYFKHSHIYYSLFAAVYVTTDH